MDILDYKTQIKVTTTPSGDKVIALSQYMYNELLVNIFDAYKYQQERKYTATAKSTAEMWDVLRGERRKENPCE